MKNITHYCVIEFNTYAVSTPNKEAALMLLERSKRKYKRHLDDAKPRIIEVEQCLIGNNVFFLIKGNTIIGIDEQELGFNTLNDVFKQYFKGKDVPISKRLNDWIIERAEGINYFAYEGLPEMKFEEFKEETKTRGTMPISADHCENSIFASKSVNVAFRAWHDQVHIEMNEDFGYCAESRVAFKQAAELPEDWGYEKMLIMCEIIGQAMHHDKYNEFVGNQMEFTKELIKNGTI